MRSVEPKGIREHEKCDEENLSVELYLIRILGFPGISFLHFLDLIARRNMPGDEGKEGFFLALSFTFFAVFLPGPCAARQLKESVQRPSPFFLSCLCRCGAASRWKQEKIRPKEQGKYNLKESIIMELQPSPASQQNIPSA